MEDQGWLGFECATASARMWHWLGFVLGAHGYLLFHKPRLPLMPQLKAVTAPDLEPCGLYELLMTLGAEDTANLSYSQFSCSPQFPGLLGDLSGRIAARFNKTDVPLREVRWQEQQPLEWRQCQKVHKEHRRKECGQKGPKSERTCQVFVAF